MRCNFTPEITMTQPDAMKRTLMALCLLVTSLVNAATQPICEIKDYSFADGLTYNTVTEIIQDTKGLIWFSTWNGLAKFDGYTFKYYKTSPGDGCTMNNTRINNILQNQEGDIWCNTHDNRVYLFDVKNEKFIDVLQPMDSVLKQNIQVSKIIPLKKGVTWIICENGYNFRVDDNACKKGKGVTIFGSFDNKLKGDDVYLVTQDAEGDEWVFTNKGISIIGKKKLNNDFPFHYFIEKDKTIWLVSDNGRLARYKKESGTLRFIDMPYNIGKVWLFKELRNSILSLGTDVGLILFNSNDNSISRINVQTPLSPLNDVCHIYQDGYGDLWMLGFAPGFLHYSKKDGQVTSILSPLNERITHKLPNSPFVTEDKYGNIWVTAKKGNFCYFDRKDKVLKYYYVKPEDPSTVISPSIRNFCIDRQGNIWIGNNSCFSKISFSEKKYHILPIGKNELEVRSVMLDKNENLWSATKSTYVRIYDAKNNLLGYLSKTGSLTKTESCFERNVYCMMEDHEGNIWLGTKFDGLYLLKRNKQNEYNFSMEHFVNNPSDKYSLSNNDVYALYQDESSRIWVGTHGGGLNLLEIDENGTKRFINSANKLENYPILYASKVRHIVETQGVLMVGTTDGLITFSSSFEYPEGIKFYRNTRNGANVSSLSNNDVMYVFSDREDHTYVVTQGGGINKVVSDNLTSDNIKFKSFSEKNGMPADLARSMVEDRNGILWIASKYTLTKYNPRLGTFDNFGSFAFKQNFSFSESTITLNAAGNVVLGTDKGLLELTPTAFKKSKYVPQIIFTELNIHGEPLSINIDRMDKLELQPNQRNFTIGFAALDYNGSDEIKYAYKLVGLDQEWHYLDRNRYASYINLPNGEYRFLVKSTNSDGVWVNNEREIEIWVLPTFWETGWAVLLYILLGMLVLMIVVAVLFTIFRLRHKVDLEKQLSNIKLRFFTDISHELRTPLTLISSPISEILEYENLSETARENLTMVQHNTDRMLRLVNQILDFRKIENKKMKVLVEETEIISFTRSIMEHFQFISKDNEIHFTLDSDCEVLNLWVDKDKFEKILFNLLSNAFKYTSTGKTITIKITTLPDKASIAVIDEGIGIPEKKIASIFQRFETLVNQNVLRHSSGLGLSLVKELMELHHGFIEVKSEQGVGSEFKVTFLSGNNHFLKDKQAEFILSDNKNTEKATGEEVIPSEEIAFPEENLEDEDDKWTILVVEDNQELLRLLRNMLSREYKIIEAIDGKDGLEKAISLIPDMIVSDVAMPVMDGLEMVKAIKENKDICHIPIILLSAKASLDDRISGIERGIDDYITKPFSATYLKTRIHSLITQRKSLQKSYLSSLHTGDKASIQLLPSQPQIASYDEIFIQQLMEYMENNLDNASLAIEDFAKELFMSRTVFYRKIKTLLGVSPIDFVKDIRLKRAIQLIDFGEYSFSEITYMCGFSDPNYFGKWFKKYMGMSPSDYKNRNNRKEEIE